MAVILRGAIVALALGPLLGVLLGLGACSGIDLGDNPGREVRKESGPLTVPPPGVRRGTDP